MRHCSKNMLNFVLLLIKDLCFLARKKRFLSLLFSKICHNRTRDVITVPEQCSWSYFIQQVVSTESLLICMYIQTNESTVDGDDIFTTTISSDLDRIANRQILHLMLHKYQSCRQFLQTPQIQCHHCKWNLCV